MEKYRIIETKTPVLSRTNGKVDFIPEIEYRYSYHVECLVVDKFLWMKSEDWIEVRFWGDNGVRNKFRSVEEAQKYIDIREKQIETNIVWKN